MSTSRKKHHIVMITLIILTIIIGAIGVYRYQKIKMFDKSLFKTLYTNLEEDSQEFNSQLDLRDYITAWADENHLKYSIDEYDNIIFHQNAVNRKSNISPTVVVVNYNYDNAKSNRRVLASAAMIALTKLDSGEKTVIFVNNVNNDGEAYRNLDKSLFPNKAKIIYLDYGKGAYVSNKSFAQKDQEICIPLEKEPVSCDTAIRIRIGGINSDVIDTGVSKHTNPLSLISTVLTRLKTKSTICQITDIKVHNRGYMYPTGAEMTVVLNSYAVESFTKYLDKRIEKFEDTLKEDNPYCYYTYEILDESSDIYPEDAYKYEVFNSLTTALYALDSGVYRYDEDEEIPEGYEESSIYGLNCLRQLRIEDDSIYLDVSSQAENKTKMEELTSDNEAVAKLAECTIRDTKDLASFSNDDTGLINTLKTTYFKVNDLSGTSISLKDTYDTYFTPMTYLQEINSNSDIVHVKESSKSAAVLTNMLLCYIQTKGNFLSL